jgi:hypothetical protein
VQRLVAAIRAWLARVLGREQPSRDAKREFDEFFGS